MGSPSVFANGQVWLAFIRRERHRPKGAISSRMPRTDPTRETSHTEARPHCYKCDKPLGMCLCARLTPIPNAVGVHVLQHRQERRHAVGTTRLLKLGLASVRVHVLAMKGASSASPRVDLPVAAGLLYPSDDARELATLPVEDRPAHLVVIDGTWDQAHRIFRDNPWIAELPRFRLSPEEPSQYRIRIEPRHECLSTLESVVAALRCLQPDLEGTDTLLSAFDAMIDAQIAAAARPSRPRTRPRRGPAKPVPHPLSAPNVAVVYAEAEPGKEIDPAQRDSMRLSAISLDGNRVFDRLMLTRTAPDAYLRSLMGIDADALALARPTDEVLRDFSAFLEADEPLVLASWNTRTQVWLEGRLGVPCLSLKAVWANHSKVRVPDLATVVDGLGLDVAEVGLSGRAGRRLALGRAMAQHLRGLVLTIERAERDVTLPLRLRVLGTGPTDGAALSGDLGPATRHWVARFGDEVVGCASVARVRGWVLRGMAVAPEHQRKGLGSRMLRVITDEVEHPMWCNARLDAVPFYTATGWVDEGPIFEMEERGPHQRMTWSQQAARPTTGTASPTST